jgi:ABC-type nitrate/sulfonate/bicarbonate transport system substrate-binding protein
MLKILGALFSIFVLQNSVHAADKIRIGFPDLAAPFVSLAVGQKRGFFVDEGFQPEFIRMNPAIAFQALVGGEIDYYTVLFPGVAAAIRGVPVKIVAVTCRAQLLRLLPDPSSNRFKSFEARLSGSTLSAARLNPQPG